MSGSIALLGKAVVFWVARAIGQDSLIEAILKHSKWALFHPKPPICTGLGSLRKRRFFGSFWNICSNLPFFGQNCSFSSYGFFKERPFPPFLGRLVLVLLSWQEGTLEVNLFLLFDGLPESCLRLSDSLFFSWSEVSSEGFFWDALPGIRFWW